jgi:ferredoxin
MKLPGKNPYTLSLGGRNYGFDPGELYGPVTDEKLCSLCGVCAEVCPTGAVELKRVVCNPSPRTGLNVFMVSNNEDVCVWCCACVRNCPTGARIRRPRMFYVTNWLFTNCTEKKEPETYL